MKVFLSSVSTGFEEFRAAASAGVQALGHDVVRAEDFQASPTSPRVACLAGVRDSDAVIVLLGERYGDVQPSGRSPTHEEFEEARDSKPVFVFIQSDTSPEARQAQFISEAQAWATGSYVTRFSDTRSLQNFVTTAIHRWELSHHAGEIDSDELGRRALTLLPQEERGYSSGAGPTVALSMVGAPRQSIIRPSELEAEGFQRDLKQRSLFGKPNIFSTDHGIRSSLDQHALVLSQAHSSLRLDQEGSVTLVLELPSPDRGLPAIIEEDVQSFLKLGMEFSIQILETIDPKERISHIGIAAALLHASYSGWRTRREHQRSPNAMTIAHQSHDSLSPGVVPSPPHRSRSALRQQYKTLAEDLTVLLRRRLRA
jgi:uncharacterized protein DUF4062